MEEKPLQSVVHNIIQRLSAPEGHGRSVLAERWSEIAGPRFSGHTQARFGMDKRVTVWVDDSTLAFELSRKYKPAMLKRLQNEFGEHEVEDIRFFVGELR